MIGMAHDRNIVTQYRMTPQMAQKLVRELAQNSSNIIWRGHAQERSEERDITFLDALMILRTGIIEGNPQAGKYPGEWKCKLVKKLRENRDAGVVTIIMTKQSKLKVVTVEWENLR